MIATQNVRRVNIGMPVYNGARWLAEAIESVLGQTFQGFELIISDNGSADATPAICQEYAARDPRVRYVRHEVNRGCPWNFNRVFELSSSPYFKWAGCDDVCQPTFLERCVEILDREPDVAWCHSQSLHINAHGKPFFGDATVPVSYADRSPSGEQNALDVTRASARPSDRFKAVILGQGGCLDSYGLIRSEVIRKTAVYLPYYGSEKVFMAELALWGRYAEVPEPLLHVRAHESAGGNMRSRREQGFFTNPFARSWRSDRLGLLRGYVRGVARSDLPAEERLRCYLAIGQYLLQLRKWKSVLWKALSGAGLAAEYPVANAARNRRGVPT